MPAGRYGSDPVLEALAFLTVFGGARPFTPRAVAWFPWAGAVAGLAVGGVWWGAAMVLPAGPAAGVALVADLAVTGMLHVDGLADAADGLLPPMDRQRRLAVMADPAVGAFGVAVVFVTLLARWAALAAITPRVALVVALWTASRATMAVALVLGGAARPGGLADTLRGAPRTAVVESSVVALAAAAALLAGGPGGPAPLAGVLAGAGVVALSHRRIGGHTGDVLGACGVVVETVGLVVAAAKW